MAFPALAPTTRTYEPGDWPVRTYSALSGAEVRIRYGNLRSGAKLSLNYDNISDTQAQEFISHYLQTQGTFITFSIPPAIRAGWEGSNTAFEPGSAGAQYRYAQAPQITAVRPGVSSVRVELVGVV